MWNEVGNLAGVKPLIRLKVATLPRILAANPGPQGNMANRPTKMANDHLASP